MTSEKDYGDARTAYWHGVGLHRDGAAGQRPDRAGRHQHGPRGSRQLQRHAGRCPSCSAPRVSIRATSRRSGRPSFRGLASYTLPKIDVLVSASMRSLEATPGGGVATNGLLAGGELRRAEHASSQQSLGRLPANALATGTTTVNLLNPGRALHAGAHNLVDMRFAKILRFGGTAHRRRRRPVQPVQLERHDRLSADVRAPDQRRRVADADGHRGAAPGADQRHVQLLGTPRGWATTGLAPHRHRQRVFLWGRWLS